MSTARFAFRWAMRLGVVMCWVALFQQDIPACLGWLVMAFSSAVIEMELS